MAIYKTGTVPLSEYEEVKQKNRELLKENTDLKMQVSYLQKELARMREANLYVN